MAHDDGQPSADLSVAAPARTLPSADTDFFQLLRLLERDGRAFGHGRDPELEPARLGQSVRQTFATKDIEAVRPGDPPRIDVNVLGLMGPEGPMPLHMTRWTLDRLSERWFSGEGTEADTTFSDLCNMLQHRMISLFYRAWADTRPEVETERATPGQVSHMLAALGGLGLPGTQTEPNLDPIKKRQAAGLALAPHAPERLSLFLTDTLGDQVTVCEFVGNMMEIPSHLQSRLGAAHSSLGRDMAVGARVFERRNRIEIRLGPLSLDRFLALMPGTETLALVRRAVLFAIGQELTVDLRLILRAEDVPEPRIGQAALSRSAWLPGKEQRDADDFCMAAIVGPGYAFEQTEGELAA